MTTVIVYLISRQSNINTYLSPVNDCVLVINQKTYYKFYSSKLNANLRNLLVQNSLNTPNNSFLNNNNAIPPHKKPIIFDEH